jgi:hypothetical protein
VAEHKVNLPSTRTEYRGKGCIMGISFYNLM